MVVERFHHSTKGVPLQVGNRVQAEKSCAPCASRASSGYRCVGNGAITPHRGTIIHIESESLYFRMLMSIVMPPRLQTIHNKVRRLMGLTKKDRQGVP